MARTVGKVAGVRLGGIDPSVIRELSGVYKPFVKAFKELISNAFDADAEDIRVDFADDFSSVTVTDDGVGMTPFEFRTDFTRIGGGSRRWTGDRTRKGRLRIGSKGIGFLALARYCSQLEVESAAHREFEWNLRADESRAVVDLLSVLPLRIDPILLRDRISVSTGSSGKKRRERLSKPRLTFERGKALLHLGSNIGSAQISLKVDCEGLGFRAFLDFDRLLRLADTANLEELEDFASIEVFEVEDKAGRPGTRITAHQLKAFVRRELRAGKRRGYVRNVASRGGLEQFTWQLSRCTPVSYNRDGNGSAIEGLSALIAMPDNLLLKTLEVRHAGKPLRLARPIYPLEDNASQLASDMLLPVHINESGLHATGFVAGYEKVIFPAEYRGLIIRVRGVSIGDPGFLGAAHLLTGAHKAALSQITGEIVVHSGLDAADALNPGRESFYEENEQYKVLRRHLIGEGESVGGHLAQAISAVLRRSQVKSALKDVLGRAIQRRRALEDISAAVTHLIAVEDACGPSLRAMLKRRRSLVNGLEGANDIDLCSPPRIGGFSVQRAKNLGEPALVDFSTQQVQVDTSRPAWQWSLLLFDRQFEIANKLGRPTHPIAELDLRHNTIYVNWGHPARSQFEERTFLRTALACVLARAACSTNADQMMDMTLKLLSFTTGSADG